MVTIIQYGNLPKQKLLEKVPALHIFTVEGVHPNHSITSTMHNPIKNTQLTVGKAFHTIKSVSEIGCKFD